MIPLTDNTEARLLKSTYRPRRADTRDAGHCSDDHFGLGHRETGSLVLFGRQPVPDSVGYVPDRLLFGRALRMAAAESRTACGNTFIGLNQYYSVAHIFQYTSGPRLVSSVADQ